ncbi:uncharacterized protein Z519_08673 [Cladophialophora bantiana CBS 173.52]|uniref:Aminoglycoside phosphotransferase domain-containing protein n=1 Tax=Cladophialophora bantiana (strain ATCC 10958 / CBS 173.52 / CDC B-1940 / NIH 8579) TaxID=1442370 RepID=A0A0D2HJF2_CLAB1|nr:uncharacterized protein Z519_08673 [Cladophialophora bantiana CBS 173.52]KIW90890.1 hypothetical protein Z519_08673 [Cladophialophora bantiana CBS 173.52]
MKINSTARYVSLALQALNEDVLPEISSPKAMESLSLVHMALTEVLKREGPATDQLIKTINTGRQLYSQIAEALGDIEPPGDPGPIDSAAGFDNLAEIHGRLSRDLDLLLARLSPRTDPQVESLMRTAAEWEVDYMLATQNSEVEPVNKFNRGDQKVERKNQPQKLSKEYLQAFLRDQRQEGVKITEFAAVAGGYSNEVFFCTVQHENGLSEKLVVRKSNPTVVAPFLELPLEFTLLRCLQAAGFLCPRPVDLAVLPGGLDDTFYTMERLPGRILGSYFERVTLQTEVLLRLARVLAKLHNTPLESYRDFIKDCGVELVLNETVEQCYRRKLKELREYTRKVEHLPSPYVTWLFRWLENNIPECTDSPVLCHGDFNFHNVLIGDDGNVTGVLDWECAEFGAPE